MPLIDEREPLRGASAERRSVCGVAQPSSPAEAAAERRLRQSCYPPLRHVSCELREGVLTLRGRLPHHSLRRVAQEIVRPLEGVLEIDNRLEVLPHPGHPQPGLRWWHCPPDA